MNDVLVPCRCKCGHIVGVMRNSDGRVELLSGFAIFSAHVSAACPNCNKSFLWKPPNVENWPKIVARRINLKRGLTSGVTTQ